MITVMVVMLALIGLAGHRWDCLPPPIRGTHETEGHRHRRQKMASVAEDRTAGRRAAAQRHGPPGERGHGGSGPLERVTVNLIARASRALQRVVEITGDSKTDALNRAIQIYSYLEEVEANGGDVYIRPSKDAELQLLKMF
jgi:hypothetical protein